LLHASCDAGCQNTQQHGFEESQYCLLMQLQRLPQQYKPRWCKRVASSNCCIPGCTVDARVMNHPYSWDAICEHIGSAFPQKQHSNTLPLCMAHYLQLGHLNKPEMASDVICKICGIKRPHKQTQTRRFVTCPEPKLIVILERISRL